MLRVTGAEGPPPGVGLLTVICAVPTVAMSAAEIAATTSFGRFTEAGRGEPLKFSVAVDAKFVPRASMLKPSPPATTAFGTMELNVGTGYVPTFTVKVRGFDEESVGEGLLTVSCAGPGSKRAPAGTTAVSEVELTKVVVSVAKPLPENCAVAPFRKPVPVIVIGTSGPPEFALFGETEVSEGAGLKPLL